MSSWETVRRANPKSVAEITFSECSKQVIEDFLVQHREDNPLERAQTGGELFVGHESGWSLPSESQKNKKIENLNIDIELYPAEAHDYPSSGMPESVQASLDCVDFDQMWTQPERSSIENESFIAAESALYSRKIAASGTERKQAQKELDAL